MSAPRLSVSIVISLSFLIICLVGSGCLDPNRFDVEKLFDVLQA
jgi:hypothetical protein